MWAGDRGVLLLVLAALSVGCNDGDRPAAGELRGWTMDTPMAKPDLVLTDVSGRPYDLRAETAGYVTLLFFGYTNCPDVCPVHMASLAAVLEEQPPEVRGRIRVVFVSTDPERDTGDRIREWLGAFDPSFVGLRGPLEEVNAALATLMLPPATIVEGEDGEPLVAHPSAVLAFGTDDLARVRYPFGTRQADWAHDLPLLVGPY